MILCDVDLLALLAELIPENYDAAMVNPASIDIRVGKSMMREVAHGRFQKEEIPPKGIWVEPGEFLLVDTQENFNVPNGYAMDLRLKSSIARRGWDHSLAFWVDPGWQGVLTMEIRNVLQFNRLHLIPGLRFAQVIVHQLTGKSSRPYAGRYQKADSVEASKD